MLTHETAFALEVQNRRELLMDAWTPIRRRNTNEAGRARRERLRQHKPKTRHQS